ncbi:KR domain-containing protein [Streptomyces zhihengii]
MGADPGRGVRRLVGPAADPPSATAWGLGRVAALELPHRWGGLIDLPAQWTEQTSARLVGVLADGAEDQVAVRGPVVYGRRLVRATPARRTAPEWNPAGTVLITGGTGALGAVVARWLAAAALRVWCSRAAAAWPRKACWRSWPRSARGRPWSRATSPTGTPSRR